MCEQYTLARVRRTVQQSCECEVCDRSARVRGRTVPHVQFFGQYNRSVQLMSTVVRLTSTVVQVAAEQICRQRKFPGFLRFGLLIFLVFGGQGCPQFW
jgi:hypothetical protein